jgi:hypothetical protein
VCESGEGSWRWRIEDESSKHVRTFCLYLRDYTPHSTSLSSSYSLPLEPEISQSIGLLAFVTSSAICINLIFPNRDLLID